MAQSKTVSELVRSAQQLDTSELELLLIEIKQLYTQKHAKLSEVSHVPLANIPLHYGIRPN